MFGLNQIIKKDQAALISWMKLARTPNISARTFFELINIFGSADEALLNLNMMVQSAGGNKKLAIPTSKAIEEEIAYCKQSNAQIICAFEGVYPKLLRTISDPPPIITIRGKADLLSRKKIAIVGARNASINGIKMAQELSHNLSGKGYTIVSGLAKGIDAAAHKGALDTNTIGVIAGGIDSIYPKENSYLFDELYHNGIVATEYKIGSRVAPQHFPQRNRIISGLSMGVIVIEAAQKSGTLITAKLAVEQGREVFAVPGSPFDIRCSGTNLLIKNGAILIQSADDVINELENGISGIMSFGEENDLQFNAVKRHIAMPSNAELNKYRARILEIIPYNAVKIDDIIKYTCIEPNIVNFILIELELAEKITRLYGNSVMRLYINS